MGIRDIIVLTLLAASLPVCFVRPFFGILMWEIVSFLNPQRFTFGSAANTPVALAVAIPTLAGLMVSWPGARHLLSRESCLIVALWLWFTFTTVHNTGEAEFAHFANDTWLRWQFVSKVILMTFATMLLVNSWTRLRWVFLVIALSFGFIVLKAVPFMIATGGSYRLYGPPGSMIADNNDLGLALNMTLPMFFFLAKTESNKRLKTLMRVLVIVTIPAIFFTYSRGALAGLAVVLFLMIMTLRQRLVLIPVLLLATLFAVFLTPKKWQDRMNFTQEGTVIDDSALSRINAWHYCWNLVMDHPFSGGGFEAFTPALFSRYAPNPRDVHGPHSVYFGVLAEHGFPGLALYLSLILSCFATLHQLRRHALESGDERGANYASMLQFSLLGFLISGAFLGRAYFDYFFTIVAGIAIMKRLNLLAPVDSEAWEVESPELVEMTTGVPTSHGAGTAPNPITPEWRPTWTQ